MHIKATFQALTDALLPNGDDLGVHDYIIYGLNHMISIQQQLFHHHIPLASPTAKMLNIAATELMYRDHGQVSSPIFPGGGMFSQLSRMDRIRTLSALENLKIDLYVLPPPFRNNAGFVKYITDALNRLTMFGFYSEWPAYGSTRLLPPDYRRLEFFPINWQKVGYPGVAFGYRDFRGFLMTMAEVKG